MSSIKELYTKTLNRYASEFGVPVSSLGKTISVESMVLAGISHIIYLYLEAAKKEIHPDTCSEEMLLRYGELKLGRLPFQATAGIYEVSYKNGTINETVRSGVVFRQNTGDGTYILDNDFVIGEETGTFQVRALQAGFETELQIGDKITAVNPIAYIDDEVEVYSVVDAPLSSENIESYRDLVIEQYRLLPQGGSIGDYRIWASDAQGVRRVYPYLPSPYNGIIEIYVEATKEDTLDGSAIGTPSQAILNEVKEVIIKDPDASLTNEQQMRLPLSVIDVRVLAVQHIGVNISISNPSDSSATVKREITTDIEDYLYNIRPYQGGVDGSVPRNIIRRSEIERIILNRISYDELQMIINGISITSYTVADDTVADKFGEIPFVEDITYIQV